jgi:hypothetical protein
MRSGRRGGPDYLSEVCRASHLFFRLRRVRKDDDNQSSAPKRRRRRKMEGCGLAMRKRFKLAMVLAALFSTGLLAQQGQDPLTAILTKLDQVLAAVAASNVDLRAVTPNWDKTLLADDGSECDSSRFTCVFEGLAVRDNETGLVWERMPTSVTYTWNLGTNSEGSLSSAREYCALKMLGGHMGWRLPSMQELTSLADPTLNDNEGTLLLPEGHPFANVKGAFYGYWSSTTTAENANTAWMMSFARVGAWVPFNGKELRANVWCVRGGAMADRY